MSETKQPTKKATLLDGSRADLDAGVLPRVPAFPASNYTYAKRAERMRAEADGGTVAGLQHEIQQVAGSNTYARITRAYGQILIEHLTRRTELDAAVAAAEAQIAEAVPAKPKKAAKPKAAAKEAA